MVSYSLKEGFVQGKQGVDGSTTPYHCRFRHRVVGAGHAAMSVASLAGV